MGSTRKCNFLVTVVILCCISNFAYATYELDVGPVDPSGEVSRRKPNPGKKSWSPYYPTGGILTTDEFGNTVIIPYPPFINLSLDNPTSSDLLSINAWQWFNSSAYRPIDATYSITDFDINIDVVIQDLRGSGGIFAQAFCGQGATVDVGMLAEGNYTVNANMYVTPWDGSEPVLYRVLDSMSFDVVDGDPITIPEPATVLLLGMASLVLMRRKRS